MTLQMKAHERLLQRTVDGSIRRCICGTSPATTTKRPGLLSHGPSTDSILSLQTSEARAAARMGLHSFSEENGRWWLHPSETIIA